ncbi:MAG: T9SS type A sorting domain-containing protein [Candidatus Limimorpha sp.]
MRKIISSLIIFTFFFSQTLSAQQYEDFESGGFTQNEWNNSSEHPWIISDNNPYEGLFSMKSGDFEGAGTSSIEITVNVPNDGIMSFYHRISCGDGYYYGYDYGQFFIDGEFKCMIYGVKDWEMKQYNISAGEHTYQWVYNRMGDEAMYEDSYYVDNVTLFADEPAFEGGWIYYGDDNPVLQLGHVDETIDFGVTFPNTSAYEGFTMTRMSFYCILEDSFTMNIYLGGVDSPETLVHSQSFETDKVETFFEVALDNPVTVDGTQPLWVTISYSGTEDCCACCTYCGDPSSCMISAGGGEWQSLASYGMFFTIMVRAYLEDLNGNELVIDNSDVTIFPNPASDCLRIESEDLHSIVMTNVNGQVVFENQCANNNVVINTEGFEDGIYFIKINGVFTRKVVIAR